AEASPFRHGQEERRVLDRLDAVSFGRYDEQIPGTPLPGVGRGLQRDAPGQDLHGGLAGAVVLAELAAGADDDERLAQRFLVPAVDGRRSDLPAAFTGLGA